MKRGAERQLTKDGDGDDDIEEIQDPQAFQKADEVALARRPIRGLPKRALTASRSPSLNGLPPILAPDVEKAEAAPHPKFGGFVGFGTAASTASNSFTFTAPPPAASAALPSAFDMTFKSAQSTPMSVPSLFGGPKLAPLAFGATLPKPATSSPTDETDAVALKYFKSLRGLNVSFLSAISAAVEQDPFCDVANLVESYKNLRTTIQSEFDGSSDVTTNPTSIFGAKPPSEKPASLFSMPKPSIEVPPKPASTNESGTKSGGFAFQPFVPPSGSAPTRLPFSLNPEPSESVTPLPPFEPPKSALPLSASNTSTLKSSPPPTSTFSFSASSGVENDATFKPGSAAQETRSSSASPSTRPTSTTPSLGSGGMPSLFATTKPTSVFGTSTAASRPTSAFGNSVASNSNTSESGYPTPFNPSPPDSSKAAPSLFGNATASSSSTPTNIFGPSSDKPVSVFGSAFQTGAFAAGKPAGSIGNPVGFGFGTSAPNVGDTIAPGSLPSSGFTFGVSSMKPSESLFSPPMTDKSIESTPQPQAEGDEEGGEEDGMKLLPSHAHDEEGEGEEDEETTYVVRCKVYRLFKSGDKSEWKDLGIGMFRLKKHNERNVRRALMRNSSTGRILVNFRIHGSLKPTLAKTAVSFVGYENSTPTPFSIKVKTEEQARDLKEALDREIAAVQATSE